MLRLVSVLFIFLFHDVALAQFDQQQLELDSVTYNQYEKSDWKNLLRTTDEAIKQKQDFYWMNLRAAIAAGALNKSYKEQYYLQRAQNDFPYDPTVLPLLYQNYLTIGDYPHALDINKKMQTDSLLKSYYPKRPVIHLAGVEVGFKQSSNPNLYDPLLYSQVGMGFRLNRIAVYNAFSHLKQVSYLGAMQQYQYYITAMIPLKKNWTVAPAVHFLHYNIENSISVTDSSQLKGNPYLFGVNISKLHQNLQYNFGVYYSTLNYEKQLQLQPGITWFPFSNTKLLVNATANYLTENNNITLSSTLGYNLNRYIGFTASYLRANTRYYSEQNGFLVNNSYDNTGNRYMGMITYNPSLQWSVYAVYLHETKQFSAPSLPSTSYNFNMLVLGIKRTF